MISLDGYEESVDSQFFMIYQALITLSARSGPPPWAKGRHSGDAEEKGHPMGIRFGDVRLR